MLIYVCIAIPKRVLYAIKIIIIHQWSIQEHTHHEYHMTKNCIFLYFYQPGKPIISIKKKLYVNSLLCFFVCVLI